jgi:aldose sugar dehydrogenase
MSMRSKKSRSAGIWIGLGLLVLAGGTGAWAQSEPRSEDCELVEGAQAGQRGEVPLQVDEVVSGLEVPWALAFLPDGNMLATERPGRVRLVRQPATARARLVEAPVIEIPVLARGEGGLLGLVLHPDFASNRLIYLYYTVSGASGPKSQVVRWRVADDYSTAQSDRIIVDDIPAARFHNGGRLRIGPDRMLYISTGDAQAPNSAQDVASLAGKILRVTLDGGIPQDNPFPGHRTFVMGLRNPQAFDWLDNETLGIADHGPTGEFELFGYDEINVARAGDNLGWPEIHGCQSAPEMRRPALTWRAAVPPGGALVYQGDAIPQWQGDFIVAALRAEHLHRVSLERGGRLVDHEVYLHRLYGRLRELILGPDTAIYATTSNCDGRGTCRFPGDRILRITARP